jgi:hypothetical protein
MVWEQLKNGPPSHGQCFAAGTPVLTPHGQQAIESLRAGDTVLCGLSSDTARRTSVIVTMHQSRADRTLRLVVNGETIVTTEGHPFMTSQSGWKRAGDLQPGDEVQTIAGRARVEACEFADGAPVWNLMLAGSNRFCVGELGLFVHDISVVENAKRAADR